MSDTTTGSNTGLRRDLKARHITMIAVGGSIGTGLFVASGATIAQAGPGSALLAYSIIGLMVYFLMTSLGELAAYEPVAGSFSTYGRRYVDEGFGFALGWNYCYNWAITVAVDLVAAQLVMGWWFPDVPGTLWSALFLAFIFTLNYISVKGFGETEYWFALLKVVTVILFICTGFAMIFGILSGDTPAGFENWAIGDAPFVGGLPALIGVAMVVGFSFQGTELIGIAAGETEHPEKNIPKAVRQVFWRILLFYILSIFVISLIIPYTDPRLLRNDVADIAVSPFTLVFEHAGLLSAAALMNAVILTSVLSAGNSGLYASTRMLFVLAHQGSAPKIFGKLSASGVPRNALFATTAVLARHRHQPLPLPPRLRDERLRRQQAALQVVLLPVRTDVRLRALHDHHARPELPGLPRGHDRLGGRGRHLHRHPALPRHLARLQAHHGLPLRALQRHEVPGKVPLGNFTDNGRPASIKAAARRLHSSWLFPSAACAEIVPTSCSLVMDVSRLPASLPAFCIRTYPGAPLFDLTICMPDSPSLRRRGHRAALSGCALSADSSANPAGLQGGGGDLSQAGKARAVVEQPATLNAQAGGSGAQC